MSTTLTLFISEHQAFDRGRVRELASAQMADAHSFRDVGTPTWAANVAAFHFVSAFTRVYRKPLSLTASSNGLLVTVDGTESPGALQKRVQRPED